MSRNLTFAQRLLLLRREMKLSQTAFADLLHIGRSWMSQLEKGEEPSPMLLELFERIEREWKNKHGAANEGFGRGKLKAAREAKGLTQSQLAKAVGYSDVGMYQDIEEGRSQMGEKMAVKIAKVLGIDVSDLTNGSDHVPVRNGMHGTFGAVPEINLPPGMKAKYVPLLSMAQCGTMMAYDDGAYAHDGFLAFNPQDPKAFAVTLAGDSMIPRFEPGDVAVVYPSKPPKSGGVVIARLNEAHGGDVMLKLYQPGADTVTLSSYNPAYPPMTFPRSAFQWIYPVAQVTKEL